MVQCPYCQHKMVVRGLSPGSFYIRCSGCAKQFPVTVPHANAEPVVGKASKPAAITPIDPTSPSWQAMRSAAQAPVPAAAATTQQSAANPHRMAEDLERLTRAFHEAPAVNLRTWSIRGAQIGTGVIVLLFAVAQLWWWVGGFILCMMLAAVLYEILAGLSGKSYLYKRAAALLFAGGWKDWARLLIGVAMMVLAVFVLDLVPMAATLVLLALGLAAGMFYGIDRAVTAERAGTIAEAREMLKRLRLAGAGEESIRKFICEFGGGAWEEFYEALFGYESKLEARKKWGKAIHGDERPEYAAWRDPIAAWINRRLEQAQKQHDQEEGPPDVAAADASAGSGDAAVAVKPMTGPEQVMQASRMAEMMAQQAHQIAQDALRRREQSMPPAPPLPPVIDVVKTQPEDEIKQRPMRGNYLSRRYGGPLGLVLSSRLRFVVAAFLLSGFLMWRYDNRAALVAEVEQIKTQDMGEMVVLKPPTDEAKNLATAVTQGSRPLRIHGVPDRLCDTVGTWSGGMAGLILLIGSFMESSLCALMMYGAAALALLGASLPLVQQVFGGRAQTAAIIAGGAMALVTMVLKRRQY